MLSDLEKVVVGMSGGVDSSVTAVLLKEQGYEVIGATMNLWEKGTENTAIIDAQNVAHTLGIEHYVLDFRDGFKKAVVDYFISEYINGKTPNPCIMCNRYIKFGALINEAKTLGADYIATGHYARVNYNDPTKRYEIKKAANDKKDQTYVLYSLSQEQLAHVLFPLADYSKEEVRKKAGEIGLIVANKPESQEICFVDKDYTDFIEKNTDYKSKTGNFVDKSGKVIGKHKGVINYTIGQRRGLELSLARPLYVVDIDVKNNIVVLGDNEDLFSDVLIAHDLNFIPFERLTDEMQVAAKIRYSQLPAKATIRMIDDDTLECRFDQPQRAITKGQAVVFYDGDVLVGGGVIV